jgi:hypothetical protein
MKNDIWLIDHEMQCNYQYENRINQIWRGECCLPDALFDKDEWKMIEFEEGQESCEEVVTLLWAVIKSYFGHSLQIWAEVDDPILSRTYMRKTILFW